MSDVSSNTEEGHVKHGKARKKGGGNPRIDMTPMVDLAFLLLTFFVLTSNLNKAKTMEMAVPRDNGEHMPIGTELARTILIDGNKEGKFYVYCGKFNADPAPILKEYTLDPKNGIRQFMLDQNKEIFDKMKLVRAIYKSGKFDKAGYDKLISLLAVNLQTHPLEDTIVKKRKQQDYEKIIARLDKDLVKKEMGDTTFRLVGANIRNNDKAPFFLIKWGNEAKYSDIINIIDELRITDNSKYAITTISLPEYQKLSEKTGVIYPELSKQIPVKQNN